MYKQKKHFKKKCKHKTQEKMICITLKKSQFIHKLLIQINITLKILIILILDQWWLKNLFKIWWHNKLFKEIKCMVDN